MHYQIWALQVPGNLEFPALPETACSIISCVVNSLRMSVFTVLKREEELFTISLHFLLSPAD